MLINRAELGDEITRPRITIAAHLSTKIAEILKMGMLLFLEQTLPGLLGDRGSLGRRSPSRNRSRSDEAKNAYGGAGRATRKGGGNETGNSCKSRQQDRRMNERASPTSRLDLSGSGIHR